VTRRKHLLVDCNPRWGTRHEGSDCFLTFDCPEGHDDCFHMIPFTPALDGTAIARDQVGHALWERRGDTFETITLTPSIARRRCYASREEAIADGCLPEYITETLFCALHVELVDGIFHFCGDSR
jgi:hypothetical protein